MLSRAKNHSELRQALGACRGYFWSVGLFSAAINVLYLASPLYMLQVYDRVVSSGSLPTLLMLTLALLIALGAMAALDGVRARILIRAGLRLDRLLSGRVMAAVVKQANAAPGGGQSQALRDFDSFRQFITSGSVYTLCDAPWAPIYIAVIALLHPLLGLLALGCAIILLALALVNERLVAASLTEAGAAGSRSYAFAETSLRNSHVIEAMGMLGGLVERWSRDRTGMLIAQARASDRGAALSSVIRFLRLAMQSLTLGAGAYLVIERDVTSGVMFAGMILLARALMPIEQAVGTWRQFVGARAAYRRVGALLNANPPPPATITLPRPKGALAAQGATLFLPGLARPILRDVNFAIQPGETLGIIGPSGAGKSTLARLITGIHAPSGGVIRLDGANVAQWDRADFGRYVGYLPQEIELFSDTVAANIARFRSGADEDIVRAALRADVHEMILALPQGYETQIGEGGVNLSGGHRQRIALARALYSDPSLVVLDEPSSNLDMEGDVALARCLRKLKEEGRTVVIISHRHVNLGTVDKILVLHGGLVAMFGPSREVMAKLGVKPVAVPSIPGNPPAAASAAPSPILQTVGNAALAGAPRAEIIADEAPQTVTEPMPVNAPEPETEGSGVGRRASGRAAAVALAVGIVLLFGIGLRVTGTGAVFGQKSPTSTATPVLLSATAEPPVAAAETPRLPPADLPPTEQTVVPEPPSPSIPLQAASPVPSAIATPTPALRPAAELAALVARGDTLIGSGDIISARLFYERAADAGDATAALRMGQSFDPAYIGRARLSADPAAAASWYRRARDLGEPEAASRLDRFAK